MPQRKKDTLQIRQLLLHLRAGSAERQINYDTGIARNTIRRYKKWAAEHRLLEGDSLPDNVELQQLLDSTLPPLVPPQNNSSVNPYADQVAALLKQNVEVAAVYCRLKERGYEGSYSAVYRFVARHRSVDPDITIRMETPPGYEAQVDFGEVGKFIDPATGKLRKAHAFVMTLGFSRHIYAELVFDQTTLTWLAAHTRALAYFGGAPQRIVIDNLKAGIQKASFEDPLVNRAYGELAEHYGFLISPCRPATPQHKGKVESGVHFVQRNFAAGREPSDLTRANRDLLDWCKSVSQRKHGTTRKKPIELFEAEEMAALKPLPRVAYDPGIYKQVKLHRDCYVVFEGSYYSAPFRYVGSTLWARGGLCTVRLFDVDNLIVSTHERAKEPGQRFTHPDHLPAQKAAAIPRSPQCLRDLAHGVGPHTLTVVEAILSDPILDKTGSAGRLLRLADKHAPPHLEAACERALRYADPQYTTVRDILAKGLESAATPAPQAPVATTFARTAGELFAHLGGA